MRSLRVYVSSVAYRKWVFRVTDVTSAYLKSTPSGRDIYAVPPLFAGGSPYERRELLKPLYGLLAACKEWYGKLQNSPVSIGWEATLLDTSVFFWAKETCNYGFWGSSRATCFGNNGKETFADGPHFGADTKRNVVEALTSHVGGLLISGTAAAFISYLSDRLGNEYGLEVFEENGAICWGVGIKKVSNEFTDRGDISNVAHTFTGATMSAGDYEGEFEIF